MAKTDDTSVLYLSGSLEIYQAELLRQAMLRHLNAEAGPILDLGAVETCDAAGAQLLYSACQTASQAGKPLRVENIPQAVLTVWDCLGLPRSAFAAKS